MEARPPLAVASQLAQDGTRRKRIEKSTGGLHAIYSDALVAQSTSDGSKQL
jgi:hypothetical protein